MINSFEQMQLHRNCDVTDLRQTYFNIYLLTYMRVSGFEQETPLSQDGCIDHAEKNKYDCFNNLI